MASGGGSREPTTDPLDALVRSALGDLRTSLTLDLCAYLHESETTGRRLFLEAPRFEALDPSDAFELLTTMGRVLDAEREGPARIGPYPCTTVWTSGPRSRGLFAFGRLHGPLTPEDEVTARASTRALAAACHALELQDVEPAAAVAMATPARGDRPVRVAVEVSGGESRSDVWVAGSDGDRKGAAVASSSLDAVALATLNALGAALRLREVGERYVGGAPVVVVVLEGAASQTMAGAAPRGSDPLHATAAATVAAVASAY